MAEVVLSTVDLDVFGGPSTVNVSLDVGATGDRGSRIWAGPNGYTIDLVGQSVELYDVYINTTTGYMYQYVVALGSPSWIFLKVLSSVSNDLANTILASYDVNGYAVIFHSMLPSGASTSDYVVTYNIRGGINVFASSHVLALLEGGLYIVIRAYEFDGTTWSPLTGNYYTDLRVFYKGVTA